MRDPRALALFRQILRNSEAGKLAWQATAEENHFAAPMLGKYTLTLRPYTSETQWGEKVGPPSVLVDDGRGNTIVEINNNVEEITGDELQALAVFARRIALQANEKIDELLQKLRDDEASS